MHSPTIAPLCLSRRLFIDDDTFPLISDAELAKYKSLMEEDFRKNQLKPGDAGFEYDKQVPAPALPQHILAKTTEKYREAWKKLT